MASLCSCFLFAIWFPIRQQKNLFFTPQAPFEFHVYLLGRASVVLLIELLPRSMVVGGGAFSECTWLGRIPKHLCTWTNTGSNCWLSSKGHFWEKKKSAASLKQLLGCYGTIKQSSVNLYSCRQELLRSSRATLAVAWHWESDRLGNVPCKMPPSTAVPITAHLLYKYQR